ncbi:hypothetical protein AB5J52_05965 [Streptomyces sp. R39]|uniref:Undecaprenyl-diphosphatase n=1 Tax=Streptomyces sp. R39 TaxID=3238631 RepID=A0AB39R842_9ACTN
MSVLTYSEAVGVGLLQGVTELFPVSSLGHGFPPWDRCLRVLPPLA